MIIIINNYNFSVPLSYWKGEKSNLLGLPVPTDVILPEVEEVVNQVAITYKKYKI